MLPLRQTIQSFIGATFIAPYGNRASLTQELVFGGAALGDASQGREVQLWEISYDGTNVNVRPDGQAVQLSLPIAGVLSCSLGFDSNMNATIAWLDPAGAHLRYFNSLSLSYEILDILGADSCMCRTDNTAEFFSASSDVIFSYTKDETLYWRAERDRYEIETTAGPCGTSKLFLCGMARSGRFQFELRV